MANFFGQLGQGLANVGEAAVKASPYALNALMQKRAQDEQARQEALRELYQRNADNRAGMASSLAQSQGLSNIALTNARTRAAENPKESVKYIQDADGNYVAMPTSYTSTPGGPMAGPQVTPSAGQTPPQGPQGPQGPQITPIATGIRAPKKTTPSEPVVATVNADGSRTYTPRSQAAGKTAPSPAPKSATSEPLVQVRQPDGSVQYTPRSQAAGQSPPTKNSALSGQTMQTLGRLGMSFNDLKQAIDQMDTYENKPGTLLGQTPEKQAMGAAAEAHPSQEAHGFLGALNNAAGAFVSAKAQQKLGNDDPEYRTYLNNKQRVATAFTELLPRPNQQLLQLEKGLSGADVGWNPVLIKNIQARRRGGLDVLKNILGQQGMLDASGNMTGRAPGAGRGGGGATGNIDLRDTPPAGATKGNDYGIFGPKKGGD